MAIIYRSRVCLGAGLLKAACQKWYEGRCNESHARDDDHNFPKFFVFPKEIHPGSRISTIAFYAGGNSVSFLVNYIIIVQVIYSTAMNGSVSKFHYLVILRYFNSFTAYFNNVSCLDCCLILDRCDNSGVYFDRFLFDEPFCFRAACRNTDRN